MSTGTESTKELKQLPVTPVNPANWLKQNLFSSWFNSILTVLIGSVLFLILKSTLTWVFLEADWSVIERNLKLFAVGQYPKEELWRVWTCLGIVSFLAGLSAGIYKGLARTMLIGILIIYGCSVMIPFISVNSRLWLITNIAIMLIAYLLANKFQPLKRFSWIGWILAFPLSVFLLHGFGLLPIVKTNVWGGFLLTILVALVAIVLSFPLGVLLALGRTSKLPIIKWISVVYIELIRGVPLITVLFMAQVMLPLFLPAGITIDNLIRVMVGFTLFSAAYVAENVRGGLQSIPNSQYEAARALGLNTVKTTSFVILPQALRVTIPSMVGHSISMLKDTTLVAIVGLVDILGIGRSIIANPEFLGRQMEVFLFVAFVFWILCYFMSYMSRKLELAIKTSR
ncbi:amino acid ABC transporter permease [Halalkalibacter akibai]|uniref:Amino acid ABC transporter n=1 Tax=Halalkalibacter akibai (strain ATCC 43226 / DSM 21942 / CIP 109018 / JCM 9157 / 1139) TaxID=1236973 RepID=W4QQH1_HALA3|nr:amino acid ABC transporter permease [Halalkalibacter akibai]GAE34355.1 amino acid ABC transporter [Halalkalibacter akibai JCM 9157]